MGERLLRQGLVHVYTGDGKGKTSTALGLAFRALGWGARVCMIQFIKGYADIGEARIAREFEDRFVLKQFALDLSRAIGEAKVLERKRSAEEAMAWAEEAVRAGDHDLVILDEINNALHYGLIDARRVLEMISAKPSHVEIVLTGRGAPPAIIEAADYVTELRMVKHPFEKGIPARKGIDY